MNKLGTEHENLDHKVYKILKSMVLEQKLAPGAKIYQDKLAQELGISRTPLVGALKKLEQENMSFLNPSNFCAQGKRWFVHILNIGPSASIFS
jgi:DNA-binding GntR family transcriptional regulator